MFGFLNWCFGDSVSVIVPSMVHMLRAFYMPARISLHVMEQPPPAQLHCTRFVKSAFHCFTWLNFVCLWQENFLLLYKIGGKLPLLPLYEVS